jgi:hypothetical protein
MERIDYIIKRLIMAVFVLISVSIMTFLDRPRGAV